MLGYIRGLLLFFKRFDRHIGLIIFGSWRDFSLDIFQYKY